MITALRARQLRVMGRRKFARRSRGRCGRGRAQSRASLTRRAVSVPSGRRPPPGRARPRLGDGQHLRQGPAAGRQARRHRQGQGSRGRRRAQAHRAHDAPYGPRGQCAARRPRRFQGHTVRQRRGGPPGLRRRRARRRAPARGGEGTALTPRSRAREGGAHGALTFRGGSPTRRGRGQEIPT
jgi:hypothetical protein